MMAVLARLAPVALLAMSIGGCNQTINANGGPVATSVPAAGLFIEDGCVTRNITVTDPVTGELKPIRQRFCGGRPIPATHRAAALVQKATPDSSSAQSGPTWGSSAPARDAAAKKNKASSSETAKSPPIQGFE